MVSTSSRTLFDPLTCADTSFISSGLFLLCNFAIAPTNNVALIKHRRLYHLMPCLLQLHLAWLQSAQLCCATSCSTKVSCVISLMYVDRLKQKCFQLAAEGVGRLQLCTELDADVTGNSQIYTSLPLKTCTYCWCCLTLTHSVPLYVLYVRGSFDKSVTKQRHSVSFPNIKNPKYAFCTEYNSDYQLWVLLRWCHNNDVIVRKISMCVQN